MNHIVGSYRLVEHWNKDAGGNTIHQFGPSPLGYMSFDAAGNFSVHIAAGAGNSTLADTAGLLNRYYSAFGAYQVKEDVIVFAPRGATQAELVGGEGRFPYRFENGDLVIGDDKTWRRVWRRV